MAFGSPVRRKKLHLVYTYDVVVGYAKSDRPVVPDENRILVTASMDWYTGL